MVVLLSATTAGIGGAAAAPTEAAPLTGDGLASSASPGSTLDRSTELGDEQPWAEIVEVNEEYVAVEVTFPNDVFDEGEQFPQDIFDEGEQFPQDTFDEGEQFPNDVFDEGEQFPQDTFDEGEQFPQDTFDEGEQFPQDTFDEGEQFPQDTFDEGEQFPQDTYDVAYLAFTDGYDSGDGTISVTEDSERVRTPIAMDFENPHQMTLYFQTEDILPEEYGSETRGEELTIAMIMYPPETSPELYPVDRVDVSPPTTDTTDVPAGEGFEEPSSGLPDNSGSSPAPIRGGMG